MSENTISYNEELNALRQEVEHCRQEIKELILAVDSRFTEHDWFESVGTE